MVVSEGDCMLDMDIEDRSRDIPIGKQSVLGCAHEQFSGQVKALQNLGQNFAHFLYFP